MLRISSLIDAAFDNTDEAVLCAVSHSFPVGAELLYFRDRYIYNRSRSYFEVCAASILKIQP